MEECFLKLLICLGLQPLWNKAFVFHALGDPCQDPKVPSRVFFRAHKKEHGLNHFFRALLRPLPVSQNNDS